MKDRKFKAWDRKTKKMICDGFGVLGEVTCFSLVEAYLYENLCGAESVLDRFKDVVLLQYIGSRDYKRKSMCEGDIVKIKANNKKGYILREIIYFKMNASFIFASFDRSDDCTIDSAHFCYGKHEVVGNVYETDIEELTKLLDK